MPKVSKIQSGFTSGEVSKQIYARVDQPKYELGLQYCQNYMPLIQGPLIRRPGTKFVEYVKDATKLPVLIPFQFSATQNYMLEVGDKYIRFNQNEGQIITNTTSFLVSGFYGQPGNPIINDLFSFTGIRTSTNPQAGETIGGASSIATGTILEITTPYLWPDIKNIRFVQKQDTLYLTHPSYQPMKLQRTGLNTWDLKTILFQDGPYLPLNSYLTIADSPNVVLQPTFAGGVSIGTSFISIATAPQYTIASAIAVGSSATKVSTTATHTFNTGDKVFIQNVVGTTELNNITRGGNAWTVTNSSPSQAYWTIISTIGSSFTVPSPFINAYVGSGQVQPALLQMVAGSSGTYWADIPFNSSIVSSIAMRNINLIQNGVGFWGHIFNVSNSANFLVSLGLGQVIPTNTPFFLWNLGVYNNINGFPAAVSFHQDRLVFSGPPAYPQEIDASMTGTYEVFSAFGSGHQVNANNALQFSLNSEQVNNIRWMKSNSQGLLCGTQSAEWAVTPSTQNAALSPTNINAAQVTAFGSANADAILAGNAAIYIQRAQRKVRELLYYWQIGNFKSTNVSELAQHITAPAITQLVNQKEPHAFIWGLRADGALLSLTYSRDEVTLQANAGWARHILGGRSDSAGTQPIINSLGVIPSGDTTYDEVWLVTQRYTNGSTVGCIEYMSKNFDDYQPQETAYHFDCGVTYNSSIVVTGATVASSCVITAPNHGLTNSSVVRFYNTVGMNFSTTDINGNVTSSNVLNYQTFVVASAATNTFFIQDFLGNFINTNSSSVYVGSAVVNKLITSISNIGWLAGETVGVVADGGIHVNTTISQAGVLTLAYPAAVVQIGYPYNSDGQMLRTHEGSAQGTSIGSTRRVNRVAFMLHNVGDFSFGPTFNNLIPAEFYSADANNTDTASPLFDGIYRDGIESSYGFDDTICFRQSSGLPGMVQGIVRFLEENDV